MKRLTRLLLCKPNHFTVDYIINPLMQPHAVDNEAALKQWQNLKTTYENLGIKVEVIEQQPDVPDMVFATDQAIVRGNTVLAGNFRYEQRRRESIYYRDWFLNNKYQIKSLNALSYFEGGDARFLGSMLFVGSGFRTSSGLSEQLSQKLNMEVTQLRLISPDFYHLDMAFLPINDTTAFYYPAAFNSESIDILKRRIPNLIEFNKQAAYAYAANSVMSGNDIITQCQESEFLQALKRLEIVPHQVDVSEFNKAGGGIRCLTLVLDEEDE